MRAEVVWICTENGPLLPLYLCPNPVPCALFVFMPSNPTGSQASWLNPHYLLCCEWLPSLTFGNAFLAFGFASFLYYNWNSLSMLPQATLDSHLPWSNRNPGCCYPGPTNVTWTSVGIFNKVALAFLTANSSNQYLNNNSLFLFHITIQFTCSWFGSK